MKGTKRGSINTLALECFPSLPLGLLPMGCVATSPYSLLHAMLSSGPPTLACQVLARCSLFLEARVSASFMIRNTVQKQVNSLLGLWEKSHHDRSIGAALSEHPLSQGSPLTMRRLRQGGWVNCPEADVLRDIFRMTPWNGCGSPLPPHLGNTCYIQFC